MPLNKEVFRVRAISAVAFVAVMLAGLLYSAWSFTLLFTIIHFGCWWEFIRLQEKIHATQYHPWLKMGVMVLGYGIMLSLPGRHQGLPLGGRMIDIHFVLLAAGTLLCMGGALRQKAVSFKALQWLATGLVYISVAWGLMLRLRQAGSQTILGDWGWVYPMLIILTIWINDTMAYIVGSFIGKTPLSPVSPKKTWEGTVGGVILAILVVTLAGVLVLKASWSQLVMISAAAAVAGTFGDLLESKLKRLAGVKDSGQMMPGHGGFLDRFDSLLLATPAVWLLLWVAGTLKP
jgi:phosphatidate cytidylyltransferase